MKKLLLLSIIIFISLTARSQKEYYNKSYTLRKQPFKMGLIPLIIDNKAYGHIILDSLSADSLVNLQFADLGIILQSLKTDSMLNAIIQIIKGREFTDKELRSNPNLLMELNSNELKHIKEALDASDVLILPSSFRSRTVLKLNGNGNTTVNGRFRFYDLNSGELILDFSTQKKVSYPLNENEVIKKIALLVENLHPYYFNNFIVRNSIK